MKLKKPGLRACLRFGISLVFYQCEPSIEVFYRTKLIYINETKDTIYFDPLLNEDAAKSPIMPNSQILLEDIGVRGKEIRDANPFKTKYFEMVRYNSDSCDTFRWLPERDDTGPINLYNFEVVNNGGENYTMTFRFTEALKKEARPCQ